MWTEKDKELVTRLLASTKAGKRDWLPTGERNEFATAMSGKYLVTIRQSRYTTEPTHYLDITEVGGANLVTLGADEYPELAEMYELARRQALKVDDAINDILQDLGPD